MALAFRTSGGADVYVTTSSVTKAAVASCGGCDDCHTWSRAGSQVTNKDAARKWAQGHARECTARRA